MLSKQAIKTLYAPALAEGEGVGTAYEYFAKRLILRHWLRGFTKRPLTLLIAGLPQIYGLSLDFLLMAQEIGCTTVIVADDRPDRLTFLEKALPQMGWAIRPTLLHTNHLPTLPELKGQFDLAISSEVLQRLAGEQKQYTQRLQHIASHVALFAPNGDNQAHVTHSGLAGVRLDEMRQLLNTKRAGYIDMPPFPPGITRTEDQREQATSGKLEAIAMWGLGYYAQMEWLIPRPIRQSQSHIVYGLK